MFIVAVTFEIKAEHIEAFRPVIMKQAEKSLAKEPECHQFDVCFDDANPARCFLYEKYTDAAAFDTHKQTDHFADFDSTVSPWIAAKQVEIWTQATS